MANLQYYLSFTAKTLAAFLEHVQNIPDQTISVLFLFIRKHWCHHHTYRWFVSTIVFTLIFHGGGSKRWCFFCMVSILCLTRSIFSTGNWRLFIFWEGLLFKRVESRLGTGAEMKEGDRHLSARSSQPQYFKLLSRLCRKGEDCWSLADFQNYFLTIILGKFDSEGVGDQVIFFPQQVWVQEYIVITPNSYTSKDNCNYVQLKWLKLPSTSVIFNHRGLEIWCLVLIECHY